MFFYIFEKIFKFFWIFTFFSFFGFCFEIFFEKILQCLKFYLKIFDIFLDFAFFFTFLPDVVGSFVFFANCFFGIVALSLLYFSFWTGTKQFMCLRPTFEEKKMPFAKSSEARLHNFCKKKLCIIVRKKKTFALQGLLFQKGNLILTRLPIPLKNLTPQNECPWKK